jgi:hypothetical protein
MFSLKLHHASLVHDHLERSLQTPDFRLVSFFCWRATSLSYLPIRQESTQEHTGD